MRRFIKKPPTLIGQEYFKKSLIGTSDCNEYIPIYSIFSHILFAFKSGTKVLEYSLPISTNTNNRLNYIRTYSELITKLKESSYPTEFRYKIRGEPKTIYVNRGILYKDETIYMCLGINSKYILSTPIEEVVNSPRAENFTLFVSPDIDNPELKNIKRKIEQLYIQPLKDKKVDIVYTSRINSWLFKNNYKTPTFKNVSKLMQHLKEDIPKKIFEE